MKLKKAHFPPGAGKKVNAKLIEGEYKAYLFQIERRHESI